MCKTPVIKNSSSIHMQRLQAGSYKHHMGGWILMNSIRATHSGHLSTGTQLLLASHSLSCTQQVQWSALDKRLCVSVQLGRPPANRLGTLISAHTQCIIRWRMLRPCGINTHPNKMLPAGAYSESSSWLDIELWKVCI
jgi:hypothetical protein